MFDSEKIMSMMPNILGTMLYIVLIFTNAYLVRRKNTEHLYLMRILIVSITAGLADMVSLILDGRPGQTERCILWITEFFVYFAYTVIPYWWFKFFQSHLQVISRKWDPLVRIPLIIDGVFLLLNVFHHFVFIIDETNRFQRRPFFSVYFIMMIVHGILAVVMYLTAKRTKSLHFFMVISFVFPVLTGEILQMILGWNYSMIFPSLAVSLAGIYMSLKNEELYVDELTGLYNRRYIRYLKKHIYRHKKREWIGVMIDLNDFKAINDKFGHDVGDCALIETARILKNSAGLRGTVIRLGGDEFLLMASDTADGTAEIVRSRIEKEFELFNQEGREPYRLSAALGIKRLSESEENIEEFLREIDRRMYADKEQYYMQISRERRKEERRKNSN